MTSGRQPRDRGLGAGEGAGRLHEGSYSGHQVLHRSTGVVAGDVAVQLLPDVLHEVALRAVGRQEVQL